LFVSKKKETKSVEALKFKDVTLLIPFLFHEIFLSHLDGQSASWHKDNHHPHHQAPKET